MPIQQAWNGKTHAWVKYDFNKQQGFHVIDVKQKNPHIPFKGVPIRGKSN